MDKAVIKTTEDYPKILSDFSEWASISYGLNIVRPSQEKSYRRPRNSAHPVILKLVTALSLKKYSFSFIFSMPYHWRYHFVFQRS